MNVKAKKSNTRQGVAFLCKTEGIRTLCRCTNECVQQRYFFEISKLCADSMLSRGIDKTDVYMI